MDIFDRILKWILEHTNLNTKPKSRDSGWSAWVQFLMYAFMALVTCLLAIFIWRKWKRIRSESDFDSGKTFPVTPDLEDDNISADELPANRWLELSRQLMQQGNMRLALRALYLACLAHMAQQEMITIARFKSNRDYERELNRKKSTVPDLLSAFAENIRIFESVWYGMHEVTDDLIKSFNKNQERLMAFVEKY